MRKAQVDRRRFIKASSGAAAVAIISGLPACGNNDVSPSEFRYGVASGDPLTDRVILWTHAKIADSTTAVGLTWQVSSD
ncbi:MAG: twin-arginine translocation signal domain-containing protein, partial [Betaproteobacteria bacterium]|nr:twin-arginine translocation signal domain-containing protein [Betaproteobacteria bacterium]